jgi:hypothetical protein
MANGTKRDNFDPAVEFKATLDKIERPDKFAEFFCDAAESQVCIKEVLGKLIRENIKENKEVHEAGKKLFKEIIDEDKAYFLKIWWDKLKSFIYFVAGILASVLVDWIKKN